MFDVLTTKHCDRPVLWGRYAERWCHSGMVWRWCYSGVVVALWYGGGRCHSGVKVVLKWCG